MNAEPVDLTGTTMIVTGASPGSIGFATARTLASWGADVIVTSRSDAAATAAAVAAELPPHGGSVRGHELELADSDSVSRFAGWVTGDATQLDVLVNNAGMHLDLRKQWKEPHLLDGDEIHWRTNYLGTAQLTHLLMPLLRETAASTGQARVVNVVSKLHTQATNEQLFGPLVPYSSWTAYGRSKLALIHHAFELERREGGSGVHGYCLHPGSVYTHIADRGLEGSRVLSRVRRALAPIERSALASPERGAQTSIFCATAPQLAGGRYFRNCAPAEPSDQANDEQIAKRLWDETGDWIAGLQSRT